MAFTQLENDPGQTANAQPVTNPGQSAMSVPGLTPISTATPPLAGAAPSASAKEDTGLLGAAEKATGASTSSPSGSGSNNASLGASDPSSSVG